MEKLAVAIVGCGVVSSMHGAAIVDNPHAKLVAAVDVNAAAADRLAKEYGCRANTDIEQVLADPTVNVIHICTPHHLHQEMAVVAMRAGKDVLVEKPLAINVKQAEEIVACAQDTGRYLGICLQNRYNSAAVRAKQLLDSGVLGKIRGIRGSVVWYRTPEYYKESPWRAHLATAGGGVLINQALHTLDLMQWFVANKPISVDALMSQRKFAGMVEVEDTLELAVDFSGGFTGLLYATLCYTRNCPVEIEIDCQQGLLYMQGNQLFLSQAGCQEKIVAGESGCGVKAYWGTSHGKLIDSFYQAVLTRSDQYIMGRDGLAVQRMIEATYTSAANKVPVAIEGTCE